MKYYVLYNYRSVLEALVYNFFHSLMITPRPLSIIASNNFNISIIKWICIRFFTGRWKSMPYHFNIDAFSNGDSTEYHFIINPKGRQINGITFVRNSAISTKYGTVDEVELCLKILSTNCLCSPSLSLIFFHILNSRQEEHSIYNNKYYYHYPFLNLKKHLRNFVQLSLQTSKRDHLEKEKIYFCNFPILYRQRSSEKSINYFK